MSYWDTACLVKLYIEEPDSAVFEEFAVGADQGATTGDFARLEFITTARRKEAQGEIAAGWAEQHISLFDEAIQVGSCRLIPVDDSVRVEFENVVKRCFSQTPPIFIRTFDALHIAAAMVSGEKEIVATDRRLRDAATLLGFQLFPTSNL